MDKARSLWQSRVEEGKLDPSERDRKLALIVPATSYAEFGEVDFVIEAVPERMELKKAVFAELDAATPGHAILASNTSSLSITEMGLATTRPEQVVGFHFFYPASVNRLVEVIEGDDTSPEAVKATANFAQAIRKTPIRCADGAGFVVNRILTAAVSEVWRYQEQTGADTSELDRLVTESKAAPIGPFALADVLGLDTVLYVTEYLQECYGDRFHVHQRMRELVAAGDLGSKTGKGFYEHRR
jgi:3-hydroxyacyl-CoA dehydrogenase